MYRLAPLAAALGVLFIAGVASASLPPAFYTNQGQPQCTASQPCSTAGKIITFYIPIVSGNCKNTIQGCVETSRIGLDGKNDPITVDAVREGKAKYATCASDPSNYGKYFNMGTITYRSALDQKMYTVPDVICYVHDTGGAFRGRPDKLDLATTICIGCTDADAMRIASGSKVNVVGQGPVDTSQAPLSLGAVNIGTPTGLGGQIATQDSYCLTSLEPLVSVPVPAGTRFPPNCYNPPPSNALSQRPIAPTASAPVSQPATQPIQSSLGQQISNLFFGNQSSSTPSITPVELLIAQPLTVRHGNPVLVSWSSVGMSSQTPCQVSQQGQSLSQNNTGSQVVQTASLPAGTITFTLSCTTQAGTQAQQSTSVTVI